MSVAELPRIGLALPEPWLPNEAPLAMPVQSLHSDATDAVRPSTPQGMFWRRVLVLGGSLLLTLAAALPVFTTLRRGGVVVLEALALGMFTVLFAWITLSFISAVAGFILVLSRGRARLGLDNDGPLPTLSSRTALLVPTYNEDPRRLVAGLQAICESLVATGQRTRFDLFVLSDTTRADVLAAEARELSLLRRRLGGSVRLFYRHRSKNTARKAGNIADWVRRFGAAYPQMLILDADSLMAGDTIVRLAAAMESHPDVALIQTLPTIVNGRTLFARMQQFASRVYGPVQAHGLAWWQGAESNYWGHNAVIRTAAFAAHAGLPELRGRKPFAGAVLSHDFVEAAMLRRGGWALHMVPGLAGSYEEGPPSLDDMLLRDRRWCQGNLQHGAVVRARGLHWISRLHLVSGIVQYLMSPLWAMLMLTGLAIPLAQNVFGAEQLRWRPWTGSVPWSGDPNVLLWIFALTMSLLLVPKLLGFVATMRDARARRGCGGVIAGFTGVLLESVLTTLIAPITMYRHSRAVAEVLAGQDSGWSAQRRDDGSVHLTDLLRSYGGLSLFGLLIGAIALAVSHALAAWMAPVILGMMLCIPVAQLTSSAVIGNWLRRHHILQTPEESQPPAVLLRATELRDQTDAISAANDPQWIEDCTKAV